MNTTVCPEDLGLFVLDALAPEESAAVARHLPECAVCRDEVARLRGHIATLQAAAQRATVPAPLRHRLRREVWLARTRERLWSGRPAWPRAAAALAAAIGLGYAAFSAWGNWRDDADNGRTWTQTGILTCRTGSGAYPLVAGKIVLAVERKGDHEVLLAMDRRTGAHLWESPFAVFGGPAADAARAYVWRAAEGGRFRLAALDLASGGELWTTAGRAGNSRQPWPAITACDGVAWSDDRRVVLLDGATGITRWTRTVEGLGALAVPATGSGCIFLASATDVQALDPDDGHALWRSGESPGAFSSVPPLMQCDGGLLVIVRNTLGGRGETVCRDAASGTVRWRRESEMPWHLVVGDGRVFLRGARICALDSRNGAVAWSMPMGGCSPIEVADGCVYTVEGVDRKGIFALRADSGKRLWTQRMMSSCSGFSVAGDMGYLSTQDGQLRAVVIRRRGT